MARVGVKYLLNYYKHILDYKREENKLIYKNWTIFTWDNNYGVRFFSHKFWWSIVFCSERSILCYCNGCSLNANDTSLIKDLCSVDLMKIHRYMIENYRYKD